MALPDVRTDINTAVQTAFGASVDVTDASFLGQLIGIISERIASVWSNTQVVYDAWNPDNATGAALDALSAITGTDRPEATNSTVTVALTGVPSTVVSSGETVETASTSQEFSTTEAGTITLLSSWTSTTAYTAGNRVTSSGNSYQCSVSGTSGSSGPTATSNPVPTDGSVTWLYLGLGTGAVDVSAESVNTGPITANAGDLTQIVTPVTGWEGVYNVASASLGQNVGNDSNLRTLRADELAADGQGTTDAIRAQLLQILGVTSCNVFANDTDTTNAMSMPPHSVMAMVQTTWIAGSANDQLIYNALWANVAAGIVTTSGNGTPYSGTVTDSQGFTQTVNFARPSTTPIYVIIDVTAYSVDFPSDGAVEIQNAIATWGNALGAGYNVWASGVGAQAFTVPGVLDTPTIYIGTSPSPSSSSPITIGSADIATFSVSDITVNVTFAAQ